MDVIPNDNENHILLNGEYYELIKISGCYPDERYSAWMESGGAIRGVKNMGCGLNALAFLEVITKDKGAEYLDIITNRGTSFEEIGQHFANAINQNYPDLPANSINIITNFYLSIQTAQDVVNLIKILNKLLSDNTCTIAKLMRYPDDTPEESIPLCNEVKLTPGHTVVFSKKDGVLKTIDPQLESIRITTEEKATSTHRAWNGQCYKAVQLLLIKSEDPMMTGYQFRPKRVKKSMKKPVKKSMKKPVKKSMKKPVKKSVKKSKKKRSIRK